VEVEGLVTRFGEKTVHDGVSLHAHQGEVLAIVGASGSGKSVLMRELVLLQRPTAGHIRLLSQEVDALSEARALALRRRFGVLFQSGALFGEMTVAENVSVPLREHTDLSEALIGELAAVKIALAGLPPEAGALYPSQLSGGMKKRAALARAIALDPALLFLDEPGSGLDPISIDALDRLVLQLKEALGLTVIMVTHDMESLWRVADRVVLLGAGRILASGTIEELYASETPAVRAFFRTRHNDGGPVS
jgi:phospholipid/cholesterol/gamma-HCH transport system ATP-binding protein